MGMPQRPREHQLETESRTAFERAFPSQWVYRRKEDDYGIDGEAEVFLDDGTATGLIFLVQLKATDEERTAKALARSLPMDRASYYRALTLPVLMVRYLAADDELYVRWFHSHDSYGAKPDARSMTFRWQPADRWQDDTAGRLAAEAQAFLELRSNAIRFPLPFSIDIEPAPEWGISAAELGIALRQHASRRPDVIALVAPEAEEAVGQFIVRPDSVAVDLGRVTAATLRVSPSYAAGDADVVARDLLALSALSFEHVGQADAAGRLAYTYLVGSSVLLRNDAAFALSASMSRARLVREALDIAERLDSDDTPAADEISLAFTFPALAHSATLAADEVELYRATIRRRADRRTATGRDHAASRELFNLANHYRARGETHEALPLYDEALTLGPDYAQYAHFWRELAGVRFMAARQTELAAAYGEPGAHFDADSYAEAVSAYERAMEIDDDAPTRALHADALLFAGRYQDALDAFTAYADRHTPSLPHELEWPLKAIVAHEIVTTLGTSRQDDRRLGEAENLAGTVAERARAPEESAAILREALDIDALAPLAWHNLASDRHRDGDRAGAAVAYLAAGLFSEFDSESWANALFLFVLEGPQELVRPVLATGQRMSRGLMVREVLELVKRQPDGFPREQFAQGIDSELAAIEEHPHGSFDLRLLGSDGAVESVVVPGAVHRPPAQRTLPNRRANAPGRNDPCPCGSGKKYKRCHGA